MPAQKSLGRNAFLNTVKTILSVIFPIITYPYVSRVLGLEVMGQYNFAASVVSYFALIAALGINAYAIREGARLREDQRAINRFGSEIFSINIYSTTAAYLLLLLCTLFLKRLSSYRLLIAVLSVEVALTTFSVNWIYIIFEEYTFTTAVSVVLQFAAFLCLFIFVRKPEDVYRYAAITVISNYGYGLFTLLHARHYVKLRFLPRVSGKHLRSILIIFLTTVATTIYINSDITILGWIKGDYYTGIYGTSSRIYTVIKIVLNAVVAVAVPRMSYYIGKKKYEDAQALGERILDLMLALCLPVITGLFSLARRMVELYAGKAYSPAYHSLQILSFALVFAVLANFFANCVLLSLKKERICMAATVIGALVNIVLNFIWVPFYAERAAAFTTLIAEICVFLITFLYARRTLPIRISIRNVSLTLLGCGLIFLICLLMGRWVSHDILCLVCSVGVSGAVYLFLQMRFGDAMIRKTILQIRHRLVR